jgi:hypothetical protein
MNNASCWQRIASHSDDRPPGTISPVANLHFLRLSHTLTVMLRPGALAALSTAARQEIPLR